MIIGFTTLDLMFDMVGTKFNRIHSLARKVPDNKTNLAANIFKKINKVPLHKISHG